MTFSLGTELASTDKYKNETLLQGRKSAQFHGGKVRDTNYSVLSTQYSVHYFGSRASTAALGRGMTWLAISLPSPCTFDVPDSMAALTAATSPFTMTVM